MAVDHLCTENRPRHLESLSRPNVEGSTKKPKQHIAVCVRQDSDESSIQKSGVIITDKLFFRLTTSPILFLWWQCKDKCYVSVISWCSACIGSSCVTLAAVWKKNVAHICLLLWCHCNEAGCSRGFEMAVLCTLFEMVICELFYFNLSWGKHAGVWRRLDHLTPMWPSISPSALQLSSPIKT